MAFSIHRTRGFCKSSQLFISIAEDEGPAGICPLLISTSCARERYDLAGKAAPHVMGYSIRVHASSVAFQAQVPILGICRAATWSLVQRSQCTTRLLGMGRTLLLAQQCYSLSPRKVHWSPTPPPRVMLGSLFIRMHMSKHLKKKKNSY